MSTGTFEFDAPESFETGKGNYLREPGWWHLQVTKITEPMEGIPGSFEITASVLAGTVDGQKGKLVNIAFFPAKLTDKDKGEMARLKMTRYCQATNLLPLVVEKGKRMQVVLGNSKGHQFVAHLEIDEYQKEKTGGKIFLRLAYADVHHVDDPAVKDVPKDVSAINVLPAHYRHVAGDFPHAEANAPAAAASATQPATAAPATAVSADDI